MSVLAAFWAATNTDEKNPVAAALPEVFRDPVGFVSSAIGVRGADIALDNLLG